MRSSILSGHLSALAEYCALAVLLAATSAFAQVFVVQAPHVEQRYSTITPTNVQLSPGPINQLGRGQLIRFLQSEQGFAMRPLPVAVITLHANGPMDPSGKDYIDLIHTKGVSAKPGERLVITSIKFHRNDIVLDLNGGPFRKHRLLSHISVGMGSVTTPLANSSGSIPAGTRVILQFPSGIPNISGQQVEALLKPLIDFGAKSPAEAYAETLPPFLRKAIDEHRVLVGMDRDMVLYARGEPIRKIQETGKDGSSIVIWMYGEPPQPVEFVHFVGPFVVRDEFARIGEPVLVRTANEMHNYWGRNPLSAPNVHTIQLGDPSATDVALQNTQRSAPTLRNPGEKLPGDNNKNVPIMGPVRFPKDDQRPGDPSYTPPQQTSGSAQRPAAQNSGQSTPPPSSQKP